MPAHDFHGTSSSSIKIQMNCRDCTLSRLCLPGCLQQGEVDLLENIVKRNRPLHKGDHLFRAGEPMR